MRGRGIPGLLLAGAMALASIPETARGQETEAREPLFVNYGTAASIRQGDNDHHQAIYLSVPAGTPGPLYVRLFDPDTFNFHDQMDRRNATTETRFSVFGGDGAFVAAPADAEALTEAELTAGTRLAERTFGRDRRTDNRWVTLAEIDPAEGERVGDRIIFRLLVDAISGPNGNVYDVALSTHEDENIAPPGFEMFGYTSTVRMPRRGVLIELRFRVPEDQRTVTVGNFDAAFGEAFLTTPLAWYPLIASGQGEWAETDITLPERDQGGIVAVTLSGGDEYPNDATFYVHDENGTLLPFELPPRLFTLNNRPIARIDVEAPEVCGRTVSFSGDRTTDLEDDPLEFVWRFGDGTSEPSRNATHTYAEEGRYVATLEVRDPGPQLGLGSAATVALFLKEAPVALSEKRQLVGAGEETAFDGSPSTASKWRIATHRWDFGDGAVREGETVNHAFAEPGLYTVTHTVIDDSGHACNTASETFEVRVNARPVAAAGDDRRIAVGEETILDASASTDSDGTLVGFAWDFGDGATGEGEVVGHAYAAPGTYVVGLTVSDDSDVANSTAADSLTIVVNDPPVPEAGADKLVAIGQTVTFDGAASRDNDGRIIGYAWDFGDGATAAGQVVAHTYAAPGDYTVTLTVTDDSTTRTASQSDTLSVRVNAAPVAEAGEDRRIAIAEETVFDAGGSSDPDGAIVSYFWDFGDGNTATGPVAAHRYDAPGTYSVRLRVDDDSKVANSSADDSLTVIVNDPPVPKAGPDRSVAIGEPILFDGGDSFDRDGEIIAYAWDFGDGYEALGQQVEHAYAQSGRYTVTLTVNDDSTTRTATRSDTLSVRVNQPPVADAGPDQHVTASVVQFDGSRSHDLDDEIAVYLWDFGDGTGGGGTPTPTHVYAEPGTYTVWLSVTDASGTIRSSAADSMTVIVNARPIADAGPDRVAAPGEALTFQGTRSLDPDGEIAAHEWDFGDGATASGAVVSHAFEKPGTYAVRLTVRDDTGHDEAFDHAEAAVFVNAPPVAHAGPDVAAAPGDKIRFSAAASFDSDGTIESYRWDFSDRAEPMAGAEVIRSFEAPGVYSAQLTVTDDSGAANGVAVDSVRIAINHRPVADAGPRIVTDATTITFDGTRSLDADGDPLTYAWDFGDGTTGTGAIVTHTYTTGGTYPVVLTVDDGTGLGNATARTALEVAINRAPVAVAGENLKVCTGDIVVLDGSKSSDPEGSVLRYAWDFGDGTGSEIVNPTKSYTRGGTYPVTLTVRDDAGLGNSVSTDRIAIRVDQGPVAHAGEDILACAGTEVRFDGSRSTDIDGVVNSFTWDFGDGNSGGGETPVHIYERPGDYRVFLTIEGEKAGICSATSTDEVEVKIIEGPVAVIAAPSAVPIDESVTFDGSASHMADGKITAYEWDFGDGTTASGTTATHRYAEPGTYAVALTLRSDSTSPTCQTVSARHLIRVNAAPVASAGEDRHVAVGEEVVFDASASHDPDGGIVAYAWDFGDGTTATGIAVRHRYAEPGTYTATLTVRDEADLANSSAEDAITVIVNPAPAPAIDGPAVACVGEEVSWRPADTGDGAAWRWLFGDGEEAASIEASHAYRKTGRHSLVLVADDGKGRANSVQQYTKVVHVNQPPFAVAGPDRMVCPGDTVRFDAGASRDLDGAIRAYRWDFGDGTTASGVNADHVYAEPGTYTVSLTVVDDAGSSCSATTDTLTVTVNAPPVADGGGDREAWVGGANDAILLDGTASRDPDGQALTYDWQIGDGGSETGALVRTTLPAAGEIPVTLTVRDASGLACGEASDTFTILATPR